MTSGPAITVHVSKQFRDALFEAAKQQGVTTSDLVRRVLDTMLPGIPCTPTGHGGARKRGGRPKGVPNLRNEVMAQVLPQARPGTDRDASVLMKQIPKDTRTPAARMLGEPLPGRSALDMRRRA